MIHAYLKKGFEVPSEQPKVDTPTPRPKTDSEKLEDIRALIMSSDDDETVLEKISRIVNE